MLHMLMGLRVQTLRTPVFVCHHHHQIDNHQDKIDNNQDKIDHHQDKTDDHCDKIDDHGEGLNNDDLDDHGDVDNQEGIDHLNTFATLMITIGDSNRDAGVQVGGTYVIQGRADQGFQISSPSIIYILRMIS